MDRQTRQYYISRAPQLAGKYQTVEKGVLEIARRFFNPPVAGERYLDVGTGTGRDLNWLLENGYDAWGVEPVAEMKKIAVENNPALEKRIFNADLPDLTVLKSAGQGPYAGILCSAVLQHIPRHEIERALSSLASLLKKPGKLLLSIPGKRPGINAENRDETGRLFVLYAPSEIIDLLAKSGMRHVLTEESADAIKRPDVTWINLGFQQ